MLLLGKVLHAEPEDFERYLDEVRVVVVLAVGRRSKSCAGVHPQVFAAVPELTLEMKTK